MLIRPYRVQRGLARPRGLLRLNRDSPLALGLVACWPLSGDMPLGIDLANPAQFLRAHGAAPAQGARPFAGVAAQFNGSDNYLDPATTANIPALDAAKTVAFRFWIDPAFSSPNAKILLSLVHDDSGSAGASMDFETGSFWGITAMGWGAQAYGTVFPVDAGTGVAPQRWIDFVYTFDGGTTHCQYLDDGEDRGSNTGFSTTSKAPQSGSTGVVRIGSFNSAFPTPYAQGWISDVIIANRVWGPTDVYRWHDPATRHDLYWVPSSRVFFDAPASTASVGASSGLASVLGIGRSTATAVGVSAGLATVTGISAAGSGGSAAGLATVSAVGAAAVASVGVAGGSAVVLGTAGGASVWAAAGLSTVLGVGASVARAVGSSAGIATVTGRAPGFFNAAWALDANAVVGLPRLQA